MLAHRSVRGYVVSDRVPANRSIFDLPESRCLPELAILSLSYLLLNPFALFRVSPMKPCLKSSLPGLYHNISHNLADHARDDLATHRGVFSLAKSYSPKRTLDTSSGSSFLLFHLRSIKSTYQSYPRNPKHLSDGTSFILTLGCLEEGTVCEVNVECAEHRKYVHV